ncbi:MAG: diaminopimelate epimerase [Phycisphaerales bacterium]|nr:diaminopimelate epimerase [Phycisphaerales bacterium]
MTIELTCSRLHGLGNDYVIFDQVDVCNLNLETLAQIACNRHTGLGGDGIITLGPWGDLPTPFSIYNADGSQAELCGNGLRCAAALLSMRHKDAPLVSIRSAVAQHDLEVHRLASHRWRVGGPLTLAIDHGFFDFRVRDLEVEVHHIVVGNPHAVIFIDDVFSGGFLEDAFDALQLMPQFEDGVNVHLAVIQSTNEIKMCTWERGAGPTRACATGAAAVAAAAHHADRCQGPIAVHLPGGDLHVDATNPDAAVQVTGDVDWIASMQWCASIDV